MEEVMLVEIEPQEIKDMLDRDEAILIDVREAQELAQFSIANSMHNPLSKFDFEAIPQDSEKKLVFACAHGIRSNQIARYLIQEKYISKAYNMKGGMSAWSRAGLPAKK